MPASTADPTVIRVRVLEQHPAADDRPARAILALPDSDYQLQLALDQPLEPDAMGQVTGRVVVRAEKVASVSTGGRFIEPVFGPPRRFQGMVIESNATDNLLTLRAGGGCPVKAALTHPGQNASQFPVGAMVAFNIQPPARFQTVDPTSR